ncbi:unnamed protein product, partial [Ixodes hexagonus]
EQEEESAASASESWQCGDEDDPPYLHEHLNGCQTTSVLVKLEPEEILPTPAGESLHSDDHSDISYTALHLEGHWDDARLAKIAEIPAAREVRLSLIEGEPTTEPTDPSLQPWLLALPGRTDSSKNTSGTIPIRKVMHISTVLKPSGNGAALEAQTGARKERRGKNAVACEWDDDETKLLLERYERYLRQIGTKFKNKKAVFTQISRDLFAQLASEKSREQCTTRLKTVQKRKRKAVCYNNQPGVPPVEVPFEAVLDRIQVMDDCIEPKAPGNVHGAMTHKESPCCCSSSSAPSSSPSGAAPGGGGGGLSGTAVAAATNSNTSADVEKMASTSRQQDSSSVPSTATDCYMQELFERLNKMEEAKSRRREERERKKERRHEERMRELKEWRDERQAMHAETMRLLSRALNIPQSE